VLVRMALNSVVAFIASSTESVYSTAPAFRAILQATPDFFVTAPGLAFSLCRSLSCFYQISPRPLG